LPTPGSNKKVTVDYILQADCEKTKIEWLGKLEEALAFSINNDERTVAFRQLLNVKSCSTRAEIKKGYKNAKFTNAAKAMTFF
jgi:hypothetical protein